MTLACRLEDRLVSRLLKLAFNNPLADLLGRRLPQPVKEELAQIRKHLRTGKPVWTPAARYEGDIEGDWISAIRHCQGNLCGGAARVVNLFRGKILRGSLGVCNVVVGDMEGGEITLVNILAGNILGGLAQQVNLLLGDIRGGDVRLVNAVVGNVLGGTLRSANLLIGDVHGGEITKAHIIIGNVFGGHVETDLLIGSVEGGEVRSRLQWSGTG